MGNGQVKSSKWISDPLNPNGYNVAIFGDGYGDGDTNFAGIDVPLMIKLIKKDAPFDTLFGAFNFHQVIVASTDNGISNDTTPVKKTYFDSKTTGSGTICDWDILLEEVKNLDTKIGWNFHCAIVIANDTVNLSRDINSTPDDIADYNPGGGYGRHNYSGKDLVVISSNKLFLRHFKNVAFNQSNGGTITHELGHAIANLPDTTGENCKMSGSWMPFCQSCQDKLTQVLLPHLAKTTVNLLTHSISFENTPEGVTTYRDIVFEVLSGKEVTLTMTKPTGVFGTPNDTPQDLTKKVPPGNSFQPIKERLWLKYTATTVGTPSPGNVTVSCPETGLNQDIPITASTIPRPKAAAVLVLDRTGSMSEDVGVGIPKIKRLREAAIAFIDHMQKGDGIGIVRYNNVSGPDDILMKVTSIDQQHDGLVRTAARAAINNQTDPYYTTSIGAGILNGFKVLNAQDVSTASPPYEVKAMVVLTDGCENESPWLDSDAVKSSITAKTFAVGLGLPGNINTTALTKLTQNTGGYLLITGILSQEHTYLLTKYFLQILAHIDNKNIIKDPAGYLTKGAEHRIPFDVTETDIDLNVILIAYYPWLVNFRIETPGGTILDPATSEFIQKETMSYYRLTLPAISDDRKGSHGGTWYAFLSIKDESQLKGITIAGSEKGSEGLTIAAAPTGLVYDLTVQCYSNLNFDTLIQQTEL